DLTITNQYDNGYGTIDHVIPFSKGGNDTPSNLRPSHSGCNISRQDRDPAEQGVNHTSRKWNTSTTCGQVIHRKHDIHRTGCGKLGSESTVPVDMCITWVPGGGGVTDPRSFAVARGLGHHTRGLKSTGPVDNLRKGVDNLVNYIAEATSQ